MTRLKVLSIFGTRPEAVKMAPVVKELERHPNKIVLRHRGCDGVAVLPECGMVMRCLAVRCAVTDSRIEPIAVGEQRWREDDAETEIRFRPHPGNRAAGGTGQRTGDVVRPRARARRRAAIRSWKLAKV